MGGLDLSFFPDRPDEALVAYVVMDFGSGRSKPEVVYKDQKSCKLEVPYRAGYLGLRESRPMVNIVQQQRQKYPIFNPDVLLVDGNGILHKHLFGLACHVGVHLDLPTVGVAKKMYFSMTYSAPQPVIEDIIAKGLKEHGDRYTVQRYGKSLAAILLTNVAFKGQPVYVSQGHGIGLETAVSIVRRCVLPGRRLPEPVFQADLYGRQNVAKINPLSFKSWKMFLVHNEELSNGERYQLRKTVKPTNCQRK